MLNLIIYTVKFSYSFYVLVSLSNLINLFILLNLFEFPTSNYRNLTNITILICLDFHICIS